MEWLRWHHGSVGDPKWRVIARVSETHVTHVVVTWATILESASQNEDERGVISGWEPEEIAALLDLETFQIEAIYHAMQGRVLDGKRVISWEKRNPKRERYDDSKERVQRFRAKQSAMKRSVTPRNTKKSLEKRRVDKRREEGNKEGDPPTEKRGGRTDLAADAFSECYHVHIGSPYAWQSGDFPQLVKLRKRLKIGTGDTPENWEAALTNYFASPFAEYSLQHFASKFDTFKNSPLDRFNKPVNHVNGGSNGKPKSKQETTIEAAQRLRARLDHQDRERDERGATGGDAGGLAGAAPDPVA